MAIPNTTYATAIVIPSLPFSVSTTANDGGVTYDLWYRYHAPVFTVPSVFALATGLGYHPTAAIYTVGAGGAPDALPGDMGNPNGINVPITFPVAGGQDYFIAIERGFGPDATDALIEMDIVSHVAQVYPAESVLVPDDQFGFAGAVLDPATGEVLYYVDGFEAGETGDSLADGTILVENYDDDTMRLRDGCFAPLATIPGADLGNDAGTGIREIFALHTATPKFYVGAGGGGAVPATLRTLSPAGVIGPTVWTLPTGGISSLAVNTSETIAYVTGQATSLNPNIVRWDLVNNVALAPWTPGGVYLKVLALNNDHLVVSSTDTTTHVATIREFDSSQALLHTYTVANNSAGLLGLRMKPGTDEPLSVWLWADQYSPVGFSTFIKLRLSDGVHLEESTVAQFNLGVYSATPIPTPPRFGHALSCPLIILRKGSADCAGPPLPPWHVEPRVIRRLRRAPHVTADNTRVFVKVFELDLERGQGLVTGQGSDPIVHLRISRDGGQTWGEEVRLHAGAIGAYTQRVQARRLGHGRDLVFEVTVSDPIAWSLVGAWLQVDGGTS